MQLTCNCLACEFGILATSESVKDQGQISNDAECGMDKVKKISNATICFMQTWYRCLHQDLQGRLLEPWCRRYSETWCITAHPILSIPLPLSLLRLRFGLCQTRCLFIHIKMNLGYCPCCKAVLCMRIVFPTCSKTAKEREHSFGVT